VNEIRHRGEGKTGGGYSRHAQGNLWVSDMFHVFYKKFI